MSDDVGRSSVCVAGNVVALSQPPVADPNDVDGDGIAASVDNCPLHWNPAQVDSVCSNSISPAQCPGESRIPIPDVDVDGVCDLLDNCPTVFNPNQVRSI